MSGLEQTLVIDAVYTRSINLSRDGNARELVQAYLPTSHAVQALEQMELILIMALEPCTLDVGR